MAKVLFMVVIFVLWLLSSIVPKALNGNYMLEEMATFTIPWKIAYFIDEYGEDVVTDEFIEKWIEDMPARNSAERWGKYYYKAGFRRYKRYREQGKVQLPLTPRQMVLRDKERQQREQNQRV